VGKELHEADRPRARLHVRAELALLVDDPGEQSRIEPVVPCVSPDDRLILEGVPEPHPPAWLGHVDVPDPGYGKAEGGDGGGTSVAETAGGSGRSARASRQARYSPTTRGWRRASSHASASRSSKTIREIAARSIWPASSRMPVPKRSSSAARTSSSSRRSRWTMSSLEIVAAPCRANAFSASVLPAPMPPVIATATGRDSDPPWIRETGPIFRLGIRTDARAKLGHPPGRRRKRAP